MTCVNWTWRESAYLTWVSVFDVNFYFLYFCVLHHFIHYSKFKSSTLTHGKYIDSRQVQLTHVKYIDSRQVQLTHVKFSWHTSSSVDTRQVQLTHVKFSWHTSSMLIHVKYVDSCQVCQLTSSALLENTWPGSAAFRILEVH